MTEGEALSAIRGNDPALAAKAETALWQVWCRSGIREVDLLLRQGIEAIERRATTWLRPCPRRSRAMDINSCNWLSLEPS